MRPGLRAQNPIERVAIGMNLAPVPAGEALFEPAAARILVAGVRLGLFERLAGRSASVAELAAELGTETRADRAAGRRACRARLPDRFERRLHAHQACAEVARSGLRDLHRDVHRQHGRLRRLVDAAGGGHPHRPWRRDPRVPARPSALGPLHPGPVRAGASVGRRGREQAAGSAAAEVAARHRRRPRLVRRGAVREARGASTRGCWTWSRARASGARSSPSTG